MHKLIPTTATATALLLSIAGCSSPITVNATAIDSAVEIQASSGDPKPVESTGPVAVGETVATDTDGLSEVIFADKSLTRVGPDSRLTIVELSDAQAQRTVTNVDGGETWHRVKKLTADDAEYQVRTPVGTASVRGTAFAVVCESQTSCAFTVVEGVVQVETTDGTLIDVNPFETLSLPADDAAVPFPVDALNADEWIMKNMELDGIELTDAAEAAGGDTTWKAAIDGNWDLRLTITSETAAHRQSNVGTSTTRIWTLSLGTCSDDACVVDIASDSGSQLAGILNASGLVVENPVAYTSCIDSVTGETMSQDGYTTEVTFDLTQDPIESVNGVPTSMSFSGTYTNVYTLVDPSGCNGASPSETTLASVSLVRATD